MLRRTNSRLDPPSRRQFWDLIYDLADGGVTVFVSTHYMDEAEHCHRVSLMYDGHLIACDSPEQLKATALAGEVLEVEARPLALVMEVLQGQPDVKEVALYGGKVHAIVTNAKESAEMLRWILGTLGSTSAESKRFPRPSKTPSYRR